jgi:transcriptional regulator with XRE-family HTH domain
MNTKRLAFFPATNLLGAYLRARRTKLDPAALGISPTRRRTPGLRREEVAQRANISPTWYTWLEQGRGGLPSAEALDRIANALLLTKVEREHLFLIGLGRPPEVHYRKDEGVTPRLQRVLDALDPRPALLRTATWDVVAWNRGATVLLADFGAMALEHRNLLRFIFLEPQVRAAQRDRATVARFAVSAFRADAARAGAVSEIEPLVEELCRLSPEFRALWNDNEVRGFGDDVVKHIKHPLLGVWGFEHSVFAVDGRPDLSMVVYNPASPADLKRLALRLRAKKTLGRRCR